MHNYDPEDLPPPVDYEGWKKFHAETAAKEAAANNASPVVDEDDEVVEKNESEEEKPSQTASEASIEPAAPPVSPDPEPENLSDAEDRPKRNCGRSGPVTPEGKSKMALNSLRHGSCSKTLILPGEKIERWLEVLSHWEDAYPGDSLLLHDFIIRTAQSEWFRIRAQQQYDDVVGDGLPDLYNKLPDQLKAHDLQLRYLTTAERKFQREYRMLETFYEKNFKREKAAAAEPPKPAPTPEPAKEEAPPPAKKTGWTKEDALALAKRVKFYNTETGEYYMDGKYYPGPPDWVPEKITPGVYPPNHITNWKYPGDPKDRFKKNK